MNKISIEDQLEKDEIIQTTIGYSMYPMLINRKTLVKIKKVDYKLDKYDLPLYKRKDQYVIHRIIEVRENSYIIRGDNTYVNEIVPFNGVIGIVDAFYRKGKWYSIENKNYKRYIYLWSKTYCIRKILVNIKRKISSWKRRQH